MQDGPGAGSAGNAADILSPSSLRVLVCDSKASARQDLVRLLRECSYQVRTPGRVGCQETCSARRCCHDGPLRARSRRSWTSSPRPRRCRCSRSSRAVTEAIWAWI